MNYCSGNCNQGRDCTCFKSVNLFWDVVEGAVVLIAMIAVCFVIGYLSA